MLKRFIIAITTIAVFGFAWYFQAIQPVTRAIAPVVDFEIKPGTGIDQISNNLSSQSLIRSRIAFKLTVIRLGVASRIQAGYFKLSADMGATEMAEALTHAYAKQVRVTIPEGLRSEEINLLFDKAFNQIKGNRYNPSEFSSLARGKEGRLFPDTYDFVPEASASDVVKRMVTQFDQVTADFPKDKLNTITIVASLLERESASSQEMPLVAGVIFNRLDIGMALQVDATVQYALGTAKCKQINCDWWKKDLTSEDLKYSSPYNTYKNPGLPPTPIANPGKDALLAAAKPATTTALYYLHDSAGKIHFADTYAQHSQNICTYLKKDCK